MSTKVMFYAYVFLIASARFACPQEADSRKEDAFRQMLSQHAGGLGFLNDKAAEEALDDAMDVARKGDQALAMRLFDTLISFRSMPRQDYSSLNSRGEDGLENSILNVNHRITSAVLSLSESKSLTPAYDVYAKIRLLRRAATKSLYRILLDLRCLNIHMDTQLELRQKMRAELSQSIWFDDLEVVRKQAQPLIRNILKSHQEIYRLAAVPRGQELAEIHRCDLNLLITDIPHDAAIIEIVQFDKATDTSSKLVPHYDAFIVLADPNPEILRNFLSPARASRRAHRENVIRVPLGPCGPIDQLISQWRNDIVAGQISSEAANQLSRQHIFKIAMHLQESKRLYVVADGDFHNCPWSAMPLEKGKYWLEKFEIAELPYAEYLLQAVQLTSIDGVAGISGLNQALIVGGVAEDLLYSKTISDFFSIRIPQKSVINLQGDEATVQQVVAELPRALIAHFDTHGTFAAFAHERANKLKLYQTESPQNALLYSALQLAEPSNESNLNTPILTAYLLSEVDLSQLELAVLAACESSMGDDRFGEGRFALGRAFHLAGCRDVIGSLWKVDDFATSQLMIAFYESLLQGKTTAASLRSAQLAMLNRNIQVPTDSVNRSPLNNDRKTTVQAIGGQPSVGSPIRHWAAFQLSGPGDRELASRLGKN